VILTTHTNIQWITHQLDMIYVWIKWIEFVVLAFLLLRLIIRFKIIDYSFDFEWLLQNCLRGKTSLYFVMKYSTQDNKSDI